MAKNKHWRVHLLETKWKRLQWRVKRALAHTNTEPVDKISMIVVGRNDNYGGEFSERLKATIDWNYKHIPGVELIYVEWNNIPERDSDAVWIAERYPNSRCFIVPNEIHQLYSENPKIPMMEYFAKNLGVREASNDWIMSINADVFLGLNTLQQLNKLGRNYIYGTHYKNIKWQGETLTEDHINNPKYLMGQFSASSIMKAVVGNFILMHRNIWEKATGYDENLRDVRDGMDGRGLLQFLHYGAKPMVLGDHFHLDHQESRVYGHNSSHGTKERLAKVLDITTIPYKNDADWGLKKFPRKQLGKNLWELQKI